MYKNTQAGFSLVELLVALAVGTLVIIGAGQLFIVTLNSYAKVEEISRKQEAIVFAAHVLANSYRQGDEDYTMRSGDNGCEIVNESDELVIDGLLEDESGCDYFPPVEDNGAYEVVLIFPAGNGNQDKISFNVMSRNAVFP